MTRVHVVHHYLHVSCIHNHLKQKLNSANFVITNVTDLVANDN